MSLRALKNQTITNKSLSVNVTGSTDSAIPAPVISSVIICDSSYNNLDDTALNPSGGYAKVIGTGFKSGCAVFLNNQSLTTYYISSTEVRIETPSITVGAYNLMLFNSNNEGGAIYLNLSVSNFPTWSTSAGSIGSEYEQKSYASSVVASGDTPLTYSLYSGTLPSGITLSSDGTLTGTTPAEAGSTTYTFVANVKDAQGQDSTRTFTLTINVDVVTWSSPTENYIISSYEYSPISNVTLSATAASGYGVLYSPNTLPTGITTNTQSGLISGTINTIGNYYTRYTATANTTGRSATRDVVFNVNQDAVTWSNPAEATSYTISGGSAMSNVTLSATSAAGFGVQYTANALPSGVSLSGDTIYGTPDTAQTVNTLLTATAATTNRSATRNISWTITLGDTYWKYTTVLLNPIASANTFINDASNNNSQLIITGDTKPNNFNPYTEGYYSVFFDGTGDYLQTGATSPILGSGDFTLECWIYPQSTAATNKAIYGWRNGADTSAYFFLNSSNIPYFGGDITNYLVPTTAVTVNAWNHIAVVRYGSGSNNMKMYLNGVVIATGTTTQNFSWGSGADVGVFNGASPYYFTGFISNLRVVVGTAVYTSAFTPPTTPLKAVANTQLLICNSNTIVDKSPIRFTMTKTGDAVVRPTNPFITPTTVSYNTQYSTYFDGSGDYLEIADNAAFQLGGDFTIESWINLASLPTSGNYYIISGKYHSTNPCYLFGVHNVAGSMALRFAGSVADLYGTYPFVIGTWYHVAAVRSGTTVTLYVNGTSVGSGSYTDNAVVSGIPYRIGVIQSTASGSWLGYFNGIISNHRLIKGGTLYTSNFTPSTTPLTDVANTSILTCQNTTLIDNSTNAFTITSAGQAQPIALSPFTTTTSNTTTTNLGSAYFDGTGDYLINPFNSGLFDNFIGSSGYVTIECWVYRNATGVEHDIVGTRPAAASQGWGFRINATNYVQLYFTGGGSVTGSVAIPANVWTHIAFVRNGANGYIYINGKLDVSGSMSAGVGQTTGNLYVGYDVSGGGYFNGYISDLRIVLGTALYTANFLPSQAPTTAIANTQLLTCQTNGGATNNGFVDQSSVNNTITRNGNVNQGTFSPYSPKGWSAYFNGSNSSYISFAPTASTVIGTSAFTIETWVYITSYVHSCPVVNSRAYNTTGTGTWTLGIGTSGQVVFSSLQAPVADLITTSNGAVPLNTWTHIAMVRNSSNQLRIYINGVSSGTTTPTSTIDFSSTNAAYIGYNPDSNLYSTSGYYSNLRIDKTAIYNGNFTPPTSPLKPNSTTVLLTCQSARIVDNSPFNVTLTRSGDVSIQAQSPFGGVSNAPASYSYYLNGTTDYLNTPATGQPTMTGNFTVSAWLYPTAYAVGGRGWIINNFGAAGNDIWGLAISGTGKLEAWYNDFSTPKLTSTATISLNTWTYVAMTKSGSTVTIYVNGVAHGTTGSKATTFGSATVALSVGTYNTSQLYTGYISNLRILNGTVDTTVPTSAFTTSSSTLLLMCQSNTAVDNGVSKFAVTVTGTGRTTPFNPFTTPATTSITYSPSLHGGSMYFDGTGDYLNVAGTMPVIGTSDFTFECWVYLTSAAASAHLIDFRPATTQGVYPTLYMFTNRAMYYYVSAADKINGSTGATENMLVSLNAWTHIAVCRSSGSTKLFVNGTQVGSTYADTNSYLSPATRPFIGSSSYTASSALPIGYISDYNLTVGAAKYTSNFTPPYSPVTTTTTIGANTYQSSLYLTGTSGGIIDQHGSLNFETVGNTQLASESPYEGVYYSNYFDGTGDYLSASTSAVTLGSGDYTIEFWMNTTQTDAVIIDTRASGSTTGWLLAVTTGYAIGMTLNGTSILVSSNAFTPGIWNHIAVVRSSGVMKIYINGTNTNNVANASNWAPQNFNIGQKSWTSSGVANFTGWLSNLRILVGTALYNNNFTPSTTPLTSVANTSLLTCQSNDFKDNSTNNFTITKTGDTKVKSFNPFKKNTGNSLSFDGTGDYLTCSNYTQFSVHGDFTLEMWVYLNTYSAATYWGLLDVRQTSVYTTGWATYIKDNRIWFTTNNADIITPATGTQMNSGAWNHVAIVRSGSTITTYLNGVAQHTATNSAASVASTATIGYKSTTTSSITYLNGYLKDFRLTRGVARYTTTFTPPTSFDTK